MILPRLQVQAKAPSATVLVRARHLLCIAPTGSRLDDLPLHCVLQQALLRRDSKLDKLVSSPISSQTPEGGLAVWVTPDPQHSAFAQQALIRQALMTLLAEHPTVVTIVVLGGAGVRRKLAEYAVYVAQVNGAAMPHNKSKSPGAALERIELYGADLVDGFARVQAVAEGNLLCRELTVLPPNLLTPGIYRQRLRGLARARGWQHTEYDFKRLLRMGAGAFCAVAQGSDTPDAAIVHLRYRARGAKQTIALVGKGICFDTGGHNLKPARYMQGMHEDMNGSAVALGILTAATRAKLKVNIDCWLALAQNHLSPRAYKQNDVVTALNGTTIEVVHTDAEGRMVLADTLTLAARDNPAVIVDFATLTGTMHVALGNRYSGIFATSEVLAQEVLRAGVLAGERLCAFPMDEDYDSALDSAVADVKQCTMDGDADHILAARLLRRFTADHPWVHMDLSAQSCKGGLGAVASDTTGFGVAWGMAWLQERISAQC
jgi:leucyl aminopeptidase